MNIRFYYIINNCEDSMCIDFNKLDENNLVSLNQQINTLEEKQEIIESLENQIKEIEDKLELLNNDQKELEKFARENFLMKKENEDIILIK